MSRSIRISRAKPKDYENIENIENILLDDKDLPELEDIEEEEEKNIQPPENKRSPVRSKKIEKKTIPIKLAGRGNRTIQVRELDPDIIPPSLEIIAPSTHNYTHPDHTGSKIAIIGKPGTGKSNIIKSLLYEKSEIFPCAQIYSGTEDSNHAYSEFIPSTFIHNRFNQASYSDFIKRQKIAKKFLQNPWAVCVWDDITEDPKIFNLPIVQGTYKNGRHWKMLHILSLQYALDIKPVIRTNIDGSFLLRETVQRNRKVLYENYASAIPDYRDFCSIFEQVTNDYTALYIHNRTQSNDFENCVFWYRRREDIPTDFKFGCKEYWWFHEERYNPMYIDPIVV